MELVWNRAFRQPLPSITLLQNAAIPQVIDLISKGIHGQVVGGDQNRRPVLVGDAAKKLQDLLAGAWHRLLRQRLSSNRPGGRSQEGRTPFPLSDVRPSFRLVRGAQDPPSPTCIPAPTACRGDRHRRRRASQYFHP